MIHSAILADQNYREDLGDGLVLRWSRVEDGPALALAIGDIFREKEEDAPNTFLSHFVLRIMEGSHPFMSSQDYALIEDTNKPADPIVACVCLWRHRWSYAGIPFWVGRPEMVGTHGGYRNRGFIRKLFQMVHARSENRGDLLHGITGIPNFYRQFGYEYALSLEPQRFLPVTEITPLKSDEQEKTLLRPATLEDVSFITDLYHSDAHKANSLVWCEDFEAVVRYNIEGWRVLPELRKGSVYMIIEDQARNALGYIHLSEQRWGPGIGVWDLALKEQQNVPEILPSLLRRIKEYAEGVKQGNTKDEPLQRIRFVLGGEGSHPLDELLQLHVKPPYAWLIRIPELSAFLRLITPVLEERLRKSVLIGYSGEIKLDFYREGLRLVFEQGRLTGVENWRAKRFQSGSAGFPVGTFIKLLLGYRSLEELQHMFPDIWFEKPEYKVLLKTLFPVQESSLIPL